MPETLYETFYEAWKRKQQQKKDKEMPTLREYVIRADGSITRRVVQEAEIDVSEAFIAQLAKDCNIRIPNFSVGIPEYGNVGISIRNSREVYFTVPVKRLIIRAPWHMLKEGYMVPVFGSNSDPVIKVPWVPPSTMKLKLVIAVTTSGKIDPWMCSGVWLIAHDDSKTPGSWRIPIANVHDDCSCCTGASWDATMASTVTGVVKLVVENFENSLYNTDLWRSADLTHAFFRVKPKAEGGEFDTLPIVGDWTRLCMKVGTSVIQYIL